MGDILKERYGLMLETDVLEVLRDGTSNASRYVREVIRARRRAWRQALGALTIAMPPAEIGQAVDRLVRDRIAGDLPTPALPGVTAEAFAALHVLAEEVWAGNTELPTLLAAAATTTKPRKKVAK